ncbi:MAG TPA: hypothetical protein VLW50_29365 [Streptosporangiaceae bacterium]|nr:hypothetical protein [Streptosporangiaceae bacterium]
MAPPRKPRSHRYAVALDVPRADGWRAWTAAAGRFGERLAAQATPPVLAAGIDTEMRRGADYVRIRVTMTIDAADVAAAIILAWEAFRAAAGDPGAWDLGAVTAEARLVSSTLDRAPRRGAAPGGHRLARHGYGWRGGSTGCQDSRSPPRAASSSGLPVSVVDRLEVVDVDKGHGRERSRSARRGPPPTRFRAATSWR